ncbi:MAG: tetratricopeptide repeat protein [Thermodesulfovibrionales bacterium]
MSCRTRFYLACIVIAAVLVYSSTLDSPFQFDDIPNIAENPAIRDFRYFADPSLVEQLGRTKGLNPALFRTRYAGYATFALNYRLHGLDVRGYHLANVLIHVVNSLLLYWLVMLTFETPFSRASGGLRSLSGSGRTATAFFTAALFAVHPVQTQAVTYVVQRFASFAALAYLLSLCLYIAWRNGAQEHPRGRAASVLLYAASLLAACLAMKTKEFSFTLPLTMAMYEFMFLDGKTARRIFFILPFLVSTLLIPLSLAGAGDAASTLRGINEGAVNLSGERSSITPADYLITQFRVIVTYLRLLILPVGQNLDYDYPVFDAISRPAVLVSLSLLAAMLSFGVFLFRLSGRPEVNGRNWFRLASFGIFWFFITLAPESGMMPIIDVIFEHRLYLPSIGFFIALAATVGAAGEGLRRWNDHAQTALACAVAAMTLIMAGAAYARNSVWLDELRLWSDTVEKSPAKARPRHNVGLAYAKQGRTDEAIREFRTALRIKPDLAGAHYDLGVAYGSLGMIDAAIREYQAVLMLLPDSAEARNNLGLAYIDQGRIDDAIREYQTLLVMHPDSQTAGMMLGYLQGMKRTAGAGNPPGVRR